MMTEQPQSEDIESTLVFDVEKYAQHEPYERIAEGVYEWENRKTEYLYDLDNETDTPELTVQVRYYEDGELMNESDVGYKRGEVYHVTGDAVKHAGEEVPMETFVEENFRVDPVVSVTDEWESMVDE